MENETYIVLSGMKVTNQYGTFYFNEPGKWIDENEYPIYEKLHRTDGPACEWTGGSKAWYVMGKLHRTDGPAVEEDGQKEWHVNGKLHRDDGPAIENTQWGEEWYVMGKQHTEEEYDRWRSQK